MTKRRAKVINNEDLASHRPRSLRSRKRGHPDDEIASSNDVQPMLSQQDTEANVLTPSSSPPQSLQLPLQGCIKSAAYQKQTAEQTASSQREGDAVGEHSVATSLSAKHAIGEVVEGTTEQGEPVLTNPNKNSNLKNLRVESSSENNQGREEEEEMGKENSISSPSHTPMVDQPQPQSLPTSQEGEGKDGVCPTVCEEGQCGEENLEHEMESNGDSQQEPPSVICMGNNKTNDVTKEEELGVPAKRRRRRMGMCGLREKERSYSLETGKRESEKNNTEGEDEKGGEEVVDKEEERSVSQTTHFTCQSGGDTGTALVAEEGTVPTPSSSSTASSVPAGSVTEQREAKAELQIGECGEKARPEAGEQVQVSVTTSEETGGGDPGWSGGETCQANPSTEPGPVQMKDPDLGTPAGMEGCPDDPVTGEEGQKLEGGADDTMVEKDGEQRKDREDRSGETDYYPATTATSLDTGAESELQRGGQSSLIQMDTMAGATEGTTERSGVAAEADTLSTDTGPGGHNCSGEEFWEAAAAPTGSDENGNCGPDDPSPMTTQQPQASRDTHDSFGSGTPNYVSDSQLNNIVLIEEEEVVEGGGGLSSSDCRQDATELVCGLIRELSTLNRTVMASHRELENLRRGNKNVRAPARRGFGPGPLHSEI